MDDELLAVLASAYLQKLCSDPEGRPLGSPGNLAAAAVVADTWTVQGHRVESHPFDCTAWQADGATLTVDEGTVVDARPSPYTLGCDVRAPLVAASTVNDLHRIRAHGKVLVLRGDLTREQLMPKRFPFFNPPRHRAIVQALERLRPAAIVAATDRDPSLAGGPSPFALFEDGDFDIPSTFTTVAEGARLASLEAHEAHLAIRARRTPARGRNVLARIGRDGTDRVTMTAHLDTKRGTPGALDDAAGLVTLLLVGHLLADRAPTLAVDLVAINGEDDYAVPGERLFLERRAATCGDTALGINIDGVGDPEGPSAFSLYACAEPMAERLRSALEGRAGVVEGERWHQGDHHLFTLQGRPALAWTSSRTNALLASVVHTAADRPERVDPRKLVALARANVDLVEAVAGRRALPPPQ